MDCQDCQVDQRQAPNYKIIMCPLHANAGKLRDGLQKIVDDSPGDCRCDHSNENCCARVRFYCPFCIAAVALAEAKEN